MFSNFDRVRKLFADQFEGESPDIFYRKNGRAAPVRVSAAERDAFIAGYGRMLRYAIWTLVVGTVVLIGGITWLAISSEGSFSEMSVYVGTGLLMGAFLALHLWAWQAPARALRDRMPSGQARSRAEMKQIFFARITWGQLALGAVVAVWMPLSVANRQDILHGWGRLWILASAGLIILIAVQAFRKWRFESASKRP